MDFSYDDGRLSGIASEEVDWEAHYSGRQLDALTPSDAGYRGWTLHYDDDGERLDRIDDGSEGVTEFIYTDGLVTSARETVRVLSFVRQYEWLDRCLHEHRSVLPTDDQEWTTSFSLSMGGLPEVARIDGGSGPTWSYEGEGCDERLGVGLPRIYGYPFWFEEWSVPQSLCP